MACNGNCNQGRTCDCVTDPNLNPHLADDFEDFGLIRALLDPYALVCMAAVAASIAWLFWG